MHKLCANNQLPMLYVNWNCYVVFIFLFGGNKNQACLSNYETFFGLVKINFVINECLEYRIIKMVAHFYCHELFR